MCICLVARINQRVFRNFATGGPPQELGTKRLVWIKYTIVHIKGTMSRLQTYIKLCVRICKNMPNCRFNNYALAVVLSAYIILSISCFFSRCYELRPLLSRLGKYGTPIIICAEHMIRYKSVCDCQLNRAQVRLTPSVGIHSI